MNEALVIDAKSYVQTVAEQGANLYIDALEDEYNLTHDSKGLLINNDKFALDYIGDFQMLVEINERLIHDHEQLLLPDDDEKGSMTLRWMTPSDWDIIHEEGLDVFLWWRFCMTEFDVIEWTTEIHNHGYYVLTQTEGEYLGEVPLRAVQMFFTAFELMPVFNMVSITLKKAE
jgi:hypothetical protein